MLGYFTLFDISLTGTRPLLKDDENVSITHLQLRQLRYSTGYMHKNFSAGYIIIGATKPYISEVQYRIAINGIQKPYICVSSPKINIIKPSPDLEYGHVYRLYRIQEVKKKATKFIICVSVGPNK